MRPAGLDEYNQVLQRAPVILAHRCRYAGPNLVYKPLLGLVCTPLLRAFAVYLLYDGFFCGLADEVVGGIVEIRYSFGCGAVVEVYVQPYEGMTGVHYHLARVSASGKNTRRVERAPGAGYDDTAESMYLQRLRTCRLTRICSPFLKRSPKFPPTPVIERAQRCGNLDAGPGVGYPAVRTSGDENDFGTFLSGSYRYILRPE